MLPEAFTYDFPCTQHSALTNLSEICPSILFSYGKLVVPGRSQKGEYGLGYTMKLVRVQIVIKHKTVKPLN